MRFPRNGGRVLGRSCAVWRGRSIHCPRNAGTSYGCVGSRDSHSARPHSVLGFTRAPSRANWRGDYVFLLWRYLARRLASMREMKGENPNMNPSTNSAEIEAIAAAWFAKRESGGWNAADQAQLEAWLDSSTAHRIAFIRIMTAWERSGRLKALGAVVPEGTIPPRDAWGFALSSKVPTSRAARERGESVAGAAPAATPSIVPEVRAASRP